MPRSTDKKVLGVCRKLGNYYKVPALLFRILFIISTLAWGLGIFIYLLLALVFPRRQKQGA